MNKQVIVIPLKKSLVKFPLNKVVVVYWKDACSTEGWDSIDSYLDHTPIDVVTCGFLLTSPPDYVTVTTTQSSHKQINQAMSIPKAWISKVVTLEDMLVEPKKKPSKKLKLDK